MDDETRFGILARAETVPEWDRGQFIITETVKAVWAVNAQLSDQAIRAEFMAWSQSMFTAELTLDVPWVTAWTRHILTRGGLTDQ
jgi:hypothetical protein